jgi:mevalonate pyrophosphate decarboxylase
LPKAICSNAHENLDALITIFESGDLDAFIKIVESEALTLRHDDFYAVFILMKPNTLQIINAIWNLGMKRKFRLFHARCWCQCTCFVSKTLAKSFAIY